MSEISEIVNKSGVKLGDTLMHAFDGQRVFVPLGVERRRGAKPNVNLYRLGRVIVACGDHVRVAFRDRCGDAVVEWFRLPTFGKFRGDGLREAVQR